jgi:hypothetical protein
MLVFRPCWSVLSEDRAAFRALEAAHFRARISNIPSNLRQARRYLGEMVRLIGACSEWLARALFSIVQCGEAPLAPRPSIREYESG